MLEFYTIISSILLSVTSILFFLKWRFEVSKLTQVQLNVDTKDVINSAALGGYYYWDKNGPTEKFSINLIKIFNFKRKIERFSQFSKIFGAESKKINDLLNQLKNCEKENFVFTGRVKADGEYKDIFCVGNRVDGNEGEVTGVVIWFYDVTGYVQEIKELGEQNSKMKEEVKGYLNICNSLPVPVWWRNQDFEIKHCNVLYSRIVSDQVKGSSNSNIPELDENLKSMSQIAANNQRTLHMKKHMVVNGERKFFDISEVATINGMGMVGVAYDITKQEDIEKELARHISAHADLLESSSSAMAIYGPDTKLKFYNNAFVKLWGLNEKWLNNNPTYGEVIELLREQRKLPEQADFKKFRNEQVKFFKNLINTHNEFFHLPDGKTLRVLVIPHALGGLLFAYEDMTDRFVMERSYNTLIAVQKETLDNLREGVAVFGCDGVLKLYNPMYAKMWPDEVDILDKKPRNTELIERSKHLFQLDVDWDGFKTDWMERPSTKKPTLKRVERTDGKVIDKLIVPLPNGDYFLSYEDVTNSMLAEKNLRERNEALEEADKLKTEFIANVSYELRTPLTSIIGFSEVLEEEHFGKLNNQQKEYVKGINDSSNLLMSLINDILDLASIEAGYMSLDVSSFDVFSVLSSVVQLLQERCKEAGLKISLKCDQDIGSIMGDEKRIKQVIFNIIGNSIKFTKKGGSIVIGADKVGKSKVSIWVEDTGVGVAKNDKGKVFDKFFKSSAMLSAKKSGTGLGLSVVKNIVQLHGGEVEFNSTKNKGTKVMCYFKRKNIKLMQ